MRNDSDGRPVVYEKSLSMMCKVSLLIQHPMAILGLLPLLDHSSIPCPALGNDFLCSQFTLIGRNFERDAIFRRAMRYPKCNIYGEKNETRREEVEKYSWRRVRGDV